MALHGEPEFPSFGQLVRKARARRGLSQSEFAKQLRVSKQHLSALENGTNLVSLAKAAEVAAALELPAETFAVATFMDHARQAGVGLSPSLTRSLSAALKLAKV